MKQELERALPVAICIESGKKIYTRILCEFVKDATFASCITPHGSIFRIKKSDIIYDLTNDEKSTIKEYEKDALEKQGTVYNNIFTKSELEEFSSEAS